MALTKIRLSQVSGSLKKGEQSAFEFGTGTEAALKYLTFDTADAEVQLGQDAVSTKHIRVKADNKELSVGAADDLKIMHNGTDSALVNATGQLAAASNAFIIMDQALSETGLTYTKDGSIDLYYDDSKKFETTSVGATVTGILSADGVDLGDGENIRLGASQDLQIFHDSGNSQSIIVDTIGELIIKSDDLRLLSNTGNEMYLKGVKDGAVEINYDNAKKFETTSAGISVTGDIQVSSHIDLPDAGFVKIGTGDDLQLKHNGTDSIIVNTTGELNLDSNVLKIQGAAGSEVMASFAKDGAAELYYDNAKKVETTATGISVTGNAVVSGDLVVNGQTTTLDSANVTIKDKIIALASGSSLADVDSGIVFMRSSANLGGGSDMKNGALVFDGATGNAFKLGVTNDTAESGTFDVAADDLATLSIGKLFLAGTGDSIEIDTDLKIVSAVDVLIDPTGGDVKVDGNVIPNSDSADDLGADGTAWRKLYVDDIDLNGVGRIDFDANADTSIRASADDVLTFEVGATDGIQFDEPSAGVVDINMVTDGSKIAFGASGEVTLEHVHNAGLLVGGTMALQFADSNSKISNPGAGLKLEDHAVIELQATTSVQLDSPIVDFEDDGVILQFGDGDDVTLTHIHDAGLRLNGSMKLQFNDANEAVHSSGNELVLTSGGVAFSLPAADGAAGQVLKTDSSGNLDFVNVAPPSRKKAQALTAAVAAGADVAGMGNGGSGSFTQAGFFAAGEENREIYLNGMHLEEGSDASSGDWYENSNAVRVNITLDVGDKLVYVYRGDS